MTVGFTEAEQARVPISPMCRVLGVGKSGFFAWPKRPACRRQQRDVGCLSHIRTAFALPDRTHGSLRIIVTLAMNSMRSRRIARHA